MGLNNIFKKVGITHKPSDFSDNSISTPSKKGFASQVGEAIANTVPGGVGHINPMTTLAKPIELDEIQSYNLKNITNGLGGIAKNTSQKRLKILYTVLGMHKDVVDKYLGEFMTDSSIGRAKLGSDNILKQFVKYTEAKVSNHHIYGGEGSVYLNRK